MAVREFRPRNGNAADAKVKTAAEAEAASAAIDPPAIRLGGWNAYFLAKFLLLWLDLIGFHPLENLAFAALLLAPVASPTWRRVRSIAAIPVALALLYYDSWLPPVGRVFAQAGQLSGFSAIYLLELAGRFIDWQVVAKLVIVLVCYRIVARYLRVGVLVIAGLAALCLPLARNAPATVTADAAAPAKASDNAGAEKTSLDAVLQDFYAKEAQRSVSFPTPSEASAPFDVIFLQVCSLSWDDMQATGSDKHPLWNNMDYVFRHFNSVASYSGPAAIRINRAPCGQTPHAALYGGAPDGCYLMPGLQRAGFEPNLAMNHDGHFDDFLSEIRSQRITAPLMPLNGVPNPLRAFDGSPIYDDGAVLARWLENRGKTEARSVALFYNTISLHDGNRYVSGPESKTGSSATYKLRLHKLLDDINAFMQQLEQSGRRAVVVIVPEHGAAVRGDRMQIAGLRELPTPAITNVPVGIKVIGPDAHRQGDAAQVSEPTSYLAVSHIVAAMLERSPFSERGFVAADYLERMPTTSYVAENADTVMVQRGDKYFLKQGSDAWKEYAASAP